MRRYLLTWERVDLRQEAQEIRAITDRLRALPRRVMLRIPLHWDGGGMERPQGYANVFRSLSAAADLMVECVDSEYASRLTPEGYQRHVGECLAVLGRYCQAAEAGNEVNSSNWNRPPHPHGPEEVAQMVRSALAACAGARLPAAVTYLHDSDNPVPMVQWVRRYASGLRSDYALVSHYPNSGKEPIPPGQLVRDFQEFAAAVGSPVVGWGEYGTEGDHDHIGHGRDARERLVRRVEGEFWHALSAAPRYAGLGGYWDWKTDLFLDPVFREVWGPAPPGQAGSWWRRLFRRARR